MSEIKSILDFKADRRTIQKSAINSVIIQLIFKLKGLITVPIMTHYLLPREMGIYNLIVVTAYLLYPLFSLNLISGPSIYLIQEKSKDRIREMYRTAINSSILFYLIFTAFLWLAMLKFGGKYYQYFYLLLLLLYSILIYYIFACVLIFFQKMSILVKITFYKDLISVLLTILLVVAGYSYAGMIFAVVFTDIIAGAYIYRLIRKELPYKIFIDKKVLVTFLKISLPLLPVYIFTWIIQSSNSYFLVYFKGEDSVGKFSIIFGLSNMILIFNYALNMFWGPVSAKLWIDNREKYRKAFSSIFAAFSTFLFLLVLLFEFNSKFIIHFLVKRADYRDAYVIFGIIAFAFAMQVLITLLTAPLYSNKNPNMIFLSYLIGSVISTVFNFLLIPSYGLVGAAISMAFSNLVIVGVMSYLNYRIANFSFFDKRLYSIGGAFLILWTALAYLRERFEVHQLLIGNVVMLVMLGLPLYFLILKEDEKEYIFAFIKELKSRMGFKIKNEGR